MQCTSSDNQHHVCVYACCELRAQPIVRVCNCAFLCLCVCVCVCVCTHRKDLAKLDGTDPLLLNGYGSYEISNDPVSDTPSHTHTHTHTANV